MTITLTIMGIFFMLGNITVGAITDFFFIYLASQAAIWLIFNLSPFVRSSAASVRKSSGES